MRRALALLAMLLVAGCASGPAEDVTDALAYVELDGVSLNATASPGKILPGQELLLEVVARNAGPNATYASGGCGSEPWRFEIVAPNGTRIGPLGPDPRCLGPPLQENVLAANASITARLVWNGTRGWRDDALDVHREPVPAGEYTLRAALDVERDGRPISPGVTLRVRVG